MQCAHTHQLTLDSKAVGLMINLNFLKELKPYKNGYSLSYQQSTGENKLHVLLLLLLKIKESRW